MAEGDPVGTLLAADAPRWALSAARLASQALLAAPSTPANPVAGRVGRVQATFDRISAAGHGDRWSDLPSEALLTLGDPAPLLTDAWPALRGGSGAPGVRRLIRLIIQRHRSPSIIIDTVTADPVAALLLEEQHPWNIHRDIADFLPDFLLAHVMRLNGAGQRQRVRLRERLVEWCAAGDDRLAEGRHQAETARAALTPEEIEAERLHEGHETRRGELRSGRVHAVGRVVRRCRTS